MDPKRVLIVSHGHPDLSKGGAELAAYQLFLSLRQRGIETLFLARTDRPAHGGSVFSERRDQELLFHTSMGDSFNFRSRHPEHMWRDFRGLLERFQPDVIHFHHYVHMGLEMLPVAKKACPDASIVMTVHEFLALCHHDGQMVKPGNNALCYESLPTDCSQCFPEKGPADFFLRQRFIQNAFSAVDLFLAPSHFLAKRYRQWGLKSGRVEVVENGFLDVKPSAPRPIGPGQSRGHLSFFGQLNPYKGIDVLLKAMALLSDDTKEKVHLDIHGANLHIQPPDFQKFIADLVEELGDTVTMHGAYERSAMASLMGNTDWVVIPSVWWENSPMVIQEAFQYGRPVICADIGGMAEKVENGVSGVHFRARNPQSLADTISRLVSDSGSWERFAANVKPPPNLEASTAAHLSLYKQAGANHRETLP